MYLCKYLILTLLVVIGFSNFVKGNAGFMKPIPRVLCEVGDTKGCNIKNACHNMAKVEGDVNPIDINEPYEYAIFQLDAKTNETSKNTYTVQFFKDQENTGYQLLTFNQNDMNLNQSLYAVEADPIINNKKLMNNIEFDKNGYVFGTLELTFDAKTGCGKVFYSCANVRLQKTSIKIKKGTTIDVEATLILTDGKGDQLGNVTTDLQPKTIQVPGLIHHEAPTESSDIKAGGNDEINNQSPSEEEKHGNSSNQLIFSITFIGLISSIISLLF